MLIHMRKIIFLRRRHREGLFRQ